MRSSDASSAAISPTPLAGTGSVYWPRPMRSALLISAVTPRSIRLTSRNVSHAASNDRAMPMPTTSSIRCPTVTPSRIAATSDAVNSRPAASTVTT